MKARLAIAIALGAALLAVPAALGSGSQSFADSIGEDAQAPDITSVNVSNDDSANITLKVNISNRPALTQDMLILIFMNTDQNLATGAPQDGSDYVLQLVAGSVGLFQWNGSDYTFAQSQASLTYSYDATGATIHINGADLSNTKGFSFSVVAQSGITYDASGNPTNLDSAPFDAAPDPGHGTYSYKLVVKVRLKQTAFTTTPAKAGARFSASLAATESDTSAAVTAGSVTCKGVVGTTRVAATHSLRNGVATCNWKLPKTAKKKLFHGTITIASQGATLTKNFSVRVR